MEAPVMSRSKTRFTVAIAIVLVALAATMRLLPHPANFAPVAAISIFGGSVLPRRHAIWVPLAAMVASDALIGFYTLPIMLSVWGCYVLIALASSMTLRRFSLWKLALITPAGSVFFFLVSNFAVWLWSGMYIRTWSGLVQCYAMAVPFFRNTLLSDIIYTGLLFGLYAAVSALAGRVFTPSMHSAKEQA